MRAAKNFLAGRSVVDNMKNPTSPAYKARHGHKMEADYKKFMKGTKKRGYVR